MKVEISADLFNVFNHTNWLGFNGNNFGSVPLNNNGQYVDANGNPVTVSTFQSGTVSKFPYIPVLIPFIGGVGDGSATDIPRQLQLGIRVRF